jgi:hypothetical protein
LLKTWKKIKKSLMFKRYYLLYSIEQGPVFFEVDLQEGGLKSYYCFLKYSYFDFLRK